MQTTNSVEVSASREPQSQTDAHKFRKVKDARGQIVTGLWERNGRFYLQISLPGKGCRRVSLCDEQKQPVASVKEAIAAAAEQRKKIQQGELPVSRRAPAFSDYVQHYIDQITATEAKKTNTITQERSILKGWANYLHNISLNQISLRHVSEYVTKRKAAKLDNRTVNLDVLTLNNCLKFAKREGYLSGKLPTEGWERLPYKAPKRELFTKEQIEAVCATALVVNADGTPKYRNGELLADVLRFLRCSGARITSALATRWSDVNWGLKQVSLRNTKYDNKIVVDFNPELEAHLRDMHSRRLPDSDYLFPGTRTEGSIGSVRKTLELVRKEAGLPKFGFHDTRHHFISYCVMSGVDILTVAKWAGHSDGGVLIGKVYGHLATEHTQRAAQKVVFELGAQSQPSNGNLVDLTKLTAGDLISILQSLQQGNQQPLAA